MRATIAHLLNSRRDFAWPLKDHGAVETNSFVTCQEERELKTRTHDQRIYNRRRRLSRSTHMHSKYVTVKPTAMRRALKKMRQHLTMVNIRQVLPAHEQEEHRRWEEQGKGSEQVRHIVAPNMLQVAHISRPQRCTREGSRSGNTNGKHRTERRTS